MRRPVNSSQALLKKVQSLSGPDIHIKTGAASAAIRNRASLSVNQRSARRRLMRLATSAAISSVSPTNNPTPEMIQVRYRSHTVDWRKRIVLSKGRFFSSIFQRRSSRESYCGPVGGRILGGKLDGGAPFNIW